MVVNFLGTQSEQKHGFVSLLILFWGHMPVLTI